jgi:hypothetical protein
LTAREQSGWFLLVSLRALQPAAVRHCGHPRERSWGYIVGTYDKDAGPNNQRLYLNGARVVQMSDTQPIELNSAAVGIGVALLLNETSSESPAGPSAMSLVLSRRS